MNAFLSAIDHYFNNMANAEKDEAFFVSEFSDAIQMYVFGNIEKKKE